MYNLDQKVVRHNTSSVKYEEMVLKFGSNDMLPFWVADMDIKCPDYMIESLVKGQNMAYLVTPKECQSFMKPLLAG